MYVVKNGGGSLCAIKYKSEQSEYNVENCTFFHSSLRKLTEVYIVWVFKDELWAAYYLVGFLKLNWFV